VNLNEWHCVDGGCQFELNDDGEYPGQISGGSAITETAGEFMTNASPKTEGQVLADKTDEQVADGIEVVAHGDKAHGKDGCGANAKMRDALRHNAENAVEVIPIVEALGKLAGLESFGITQEDIQRLVEDGGAAAANDELWDVTPAEAVDIQLAYGAKYEELDRVHAEETVAVDVSEDMTINNAQYTRNHEGAQVFVAALGAYTKRMIELDRKLGKSDRDIALGRYAAIAFQVGVCKVLGNKNLEAAVLSKV
jgi:hypothetical protein